MMKQLRTFLKISPDKTNSDVIVMLLMYGYVLLFIAALVVGLVRDFMK